MNRGTISIVIPTYRHASFIGMTLESMRHQQRQPLEVIVINDGSPDNTDDAVRPYLDRITYLQQQNVGVAETVNRGLRRCRGDYVLMIGSDDWLRPHALQILAEPLDRDPEVGLVHGGIIVVDHQGNPIPASGPPLDVPLGQHREIRRLIADNYIASSACLCRRQALCEGGLMPAFHYCQDWAKWIQIGLRGWAFFGLAEPVTYYRRHDGNITHPSQLLNAVEEEVQMLRYLEKAPWEYSRAFRLALKTSIRTHLNRLGWLALQSQQFSTARKAFQQCLQQEGPTLTGLVGLGFAAAPPSVFYALQSLKRAMLAQ